ncbi:MAG: hypothetical protein KDC48_03630 [Planctomycetes bacterium]|nr:hypothetical protein [Planctomycetota bacterium]
MSHLRAGLSGCGHVTATQLLALREQHDCAVVALHDDDPAALDACGAATGIALRTGSYDELLATGVDFVVLAGAERLAERAALAAEQSAHVLAYAEAADDEGALGAALSACERGEVRLGLVPPLLGDPALHDLRALLAGGAIGALTELHVQAPASPMALVSLAAWLTGRPARAVHAASPDEDGARRTTLLLPGDAQVWLDTGPAAGTTVIANGSDGWCVIRSTDLGMQTLRPWRGEVLSSPDATTERWSPRVAAQEAAARSRAEPHGAFARWLEDRDVFPVPGEQLVEDLRTLAALRRSLATGRAEDVPRS